MEKNSFMCIKFKWKLCGLSSYSVYVLQFLLGEFNTILEINLHSSLIPAVDDQSKVYKVQL